MTLRPAAWRALRAAGLVCAMVAVGALAAGLWFRGRIEACLPRLDGAAVLPGLSAQVRVTRDALGVPTVSGSSRLDVARATGWLHAQDRFFQMDLLRRRGAGELAELVGAMALPMDREARMHGFRKLAREVLERESPARRALVEAYAQGVNAGLAFLGEKPWEYLVLQEQPRPWLPEDSVLVVFAMTLDLEEGSGRYVRMLAAIDDEYGAASLAFFAPLYTSQDVPLDGIASRPAPIPPPSEIDLRRGATEGGERSAGAAVAFGAPLEDAQIPGSNSLAVAGSLTAGGSAIVANDMHLRLGIPNTWYRMALRWPGHNEAGVTLPGMPALVAGSTGRIAWGFTNSGAGTGDLIVVDPTISPDLYHGPNGGASLPYDMRNEVIAVRGAKPVSASYAWTVWGPIIGAEADGRQFAYQWSADDPAATNLGLMDLEDAADAQSALSIAHHIGIPSTNFLVADSGGHIGWTLAGALPKRIGYDGRIPVAGIYGDRRWDGFLGPGELPTILSPPSGRLWTANNRTVGGRALEAVGDSGYAPSPRARQLKDDLDALIGRGGPIVPRDLLAIQLDDRAILLETWHNLLLATLTPDVVAARPPRAALLAAAQKWEGRASADSASYAVVRAFRLAVARRVFDPIFAPCVARYPEFAWTRLNYEEPLETIVRERPAHLLDPAFKTWDDLLAAAADDVTLSFAKAGAHPGTTTWGRFNTARITHPLGWSLPHWAATWLSMPADPLPGDTNMPRVQERSFGASERFVVSPGHEDQGIFHMPGGQSANPLSPYFRAGHEAWVRGDPTPFLPGPAEHTIDLGP
jgi:penicillin G amidase